MTTWSLGVDFGTSRSAGAVSANGAETLLEVEGQRWIASAVGRAESGEVVVGAAAAQLALVHPDHVERVPKRALGAAAPLLLAGEPLDPADAVAAVLRRFLAEGLLRHGSTPPAGTVLTHPARWGSTRLAALRDAAIRAELPEPRLLAEPVAAAVHYLTDAVPLGRPVAVYDLGGGTFDTAVLVRTAEGFDVVGEPGGDTTIGGEEFDHRLFQFFGETLRDEAPDAWAQIESSDDRVWRHAAHELLEQARRAKEALSSYTTTQVFVPSAERDIVVNRSQFEAMIVDDIERTVAVLESTIAAAGVAESDLFAIYLVGGSSRLPIVTQMMTERFGALVTTRDEPKSVVALGAARWARSTSAPSASSSTSVGDQPTGSIPVVGPTGSVVAVGGDPLAAVDVVWRQQLPRVAGQLGADATTLVCGCDDENLYVLDRATGVGRYTLAIGSVVYSAPVIVDGLIVTGALDGVVRAFAIGDGARRWEVASGATVAAPLAVHDGVLFVVNDGGTCLALDVTTGVARWQLPCGRPQRAGAVVAGSGAAGSVAERSVVVLCGTDGVVYASDVATGEVRWMYQTQAGILGGPVAVGDVVLIPCQDGLVYALAAETGDPRYGYRTEGPITAPLATNGTLAFAASHDGFVHAIDAQTGAFHWKAEVSGTSCSGPHALGAIVAVDTGTGDLVTLDAADGAERIRVATGEFNRGRALLTPGVVLVPTTFAQLFALKP